MNPELLIKLHKDIEDCFAPDPPRKAKSMQASQIGHPCDLFHVRNFLDYTLAKEWTLQSRRNFYMGKKIEKLWIAEIRKSDNIRIFNEQQEITWDKYNISGHIDGWLQYKKEEPILFDIKSMHPYIWQKFNENDIDAYKQFDRLPYYKKAISQGQIYMAMSNTEHFLFIIVNKSNLAEKFIYMPLDYQHTEMLIQRSIRVMDYVSKEIRPDPIEFDEIWCEKLCPYNHICLPNRRYEGAEFVDNEEIVDAAQRYFELKELAKEYTEINAYLKAQLGKYEKGGFIDGGNYEFAITETHYKAQPEKKVLAKPERIEKRVVLIDHRKGEGGRKNADSKADN